MQEEFASKFAHLFSQDEEGFSTGPMRLEIIQADRRSAEDIYEDSGENEAGKVEWENSPPVNMVRLVPVDWEHYQILRDDSEIGEDFGYPIVCWSKDRKTGIGDPGGDCSVCPMQKWESRQPPKCRKILNVLFEVADTGDLVYYRFQGTAYRRNGRFLNKMRREYGFGNFAVDFTGIEERNKQGVAYTRAAVRQAELPEGYTPSYTAQD